MRRSAKGSTHAAAAQCLVDIVLLQRSTEQVFEALKLDGDKIKQCQAQVLHCLRKLLPLSALASELSHQKIKEKDQVLLYLIVVGLGDLLLSDRADYAVVDECVAAVALLKKQSASGLVNAVLRTAVKRRPDLKDRLHAQPAISRFPGWIRKKLKRTYPTHFEMIAAQSGMIAPIWLSIDESAVSAEAFKRKLRSQGIAFQENTAQADTLILVARPDITKLPGFAEGHFFVQDRAAQLCARFLPIDAGQRILDACTAPGGKLMQLVCKARLLKLALHIDAVDLSAKRLARTRENLTRLGVNIVEKDQDETESRQTVSLQQTDLDCDELTTTYDAILLDAPCSASGVIRRHPDIPFVRKPADVRDLVKLQSRLLASLWKQLKPGGHLLYATCSIFPEENSEQIAAFMQTAGDQAEALALPAIYGGIETEFGRQWLPGDDRCYELPHQQIATHRNTSTQREQERSILADRAGTNSFVDNSHFTHSSESSYDSDGFYYCLLRKAL